MNGSRTIRVLKRDGSAESYDPHKFAACLWRAMRPARTSRYLDALDLSIAVEMYLQRNALTCVSSAALFEMAVKVLRRVGLHRPAEAMELHRRTRRIARHHLRIRHDDDRLTFWDKAWLARLGGQSWKLMPATARIIAAQIEEELLAARTRAVHRQTVLEMFNDRVAQFGLADAVPVER